MKGAADFFVGTGRVLKEFFQNDATGKLDYRFLLGIWFAWHLGRYISRIDHLSDWSFLGLCCLQALYIYGPTSELTSYFKGIYGKFSTPDTQINTDSTQVDSQKTTISPTPVKDINNADPGTASIG